ncbi:MAG: CRISPR-associated helicase/endonuclease Cas3, partial [Pyrinomonadaceae bacterium]
LKSRPGWKVAFLYPTTGTASQGFKDYASHNKKATLISSRAEFDLEGMFENPDERSENDYSTDKELYALGLWAKSSYVATVDTFLGFLQN